MEELNRVQSPSPPPVIQEPPLIVTPPILKTGTTTPTPLPINLSTLLPVSKNNLHDVTPQEMPPTWLQGGTLNIPGLSSILSSAAISPPLLPQESNQKKVMPWPGIDVIMESYKNTDKVKRKIVAIGLNLVHRFGIRNDTCILA